MKRRLIWIGLFGWLIVPVMIYAGVQTFGLPHALWSYEFYGSRSTFTGRTYTRCTFVGPFGAFTQDAVRGTCPWLAFFKSKEAAQ